jgi:hypothetical protein
MPSSHQQFHRKTFAQVKIDGQNRTGSLRLGLKQGSAIAALLFNIYMGAI